MSVATGRVHVADVGRADWLRVVFDDGNELAHRIDRGQGAATLAVRLRCMADDLDAMAQTQQEKSA